DSMVSYQQTEDLSASAKITYVNMRSYYEHYSVDWDCSKIEEQIHDLTNFDILFNGEVVGAIRLAFDNYGCYVRDLQVSEKYQNKGIGALALSECERLAIESGANRLRLRVFKISPAFHLYERVGFVVDSSDDRFYSMSRTIS
ncbi:GNAT family N-acetyltransferase, partial [Vibrio vulnificus]